MPIPADELCEEVLKVQQAGLIPVCLLVFDKASGQEASRHMLGCFAVPRVGEVIHCGAAKVGVFGVSHDFTAARDLHGTTVRLQVITVAGYAEGQPARRRPRGRTRKGRADGLLA